MSTIRNFDKLEDGCYYLAENKEVFGPMKSGGSGVFDNTFPFFVSNRRLSLTISGNYNVSEKHSLDLITKVEVNIKPIDKSNDGNEFKKGDKVKCNSINNGAETFIVKDCDRDGTCTLTTDNSNIHFLVHDNSLELVQDKEEIELFVGAICELEDGDIVIIDSFRSQLFSCSLEEQYRSCGENIRNPGWNVKKILNVKSY